MQPQHPSASEPSSRPVKPVDPVLGRRSLFLVGGAAAAIPFPVNAQETIDVELGDFYFEPGMNELLEIEPGTTVQFVWMTTTSRP